jgi:5,10-methylenetetrahydromethanopterin reductase
MSSPAYVRWAWDNIHAGMAESGRTDHRLVVYVDVKVNPDGEMARAAVRWSLAKRLPWVDAQLSAAGIAEEVYGFVGEHGAAGMAERMPEACVDALSAAGTPLQATATLRRLVEAGANSIVFQPLDGDPDCLDE